MKVKDPDGAEFRVSRRWLPWRWRKRVSGRPWEIDPFSGLDDLANRISLGQLEQGRLLGSPADRA